MLKYSQSREKLSINERLLIFSMLLTSIVLSSSFIGNPPSMLFFEYTNAQPSMNNTAAGSQNQTTEEVFVVQNTSMSKPASTSHHGQPPHAIVWGLPLRDDGKIWSGSVSFTASKPIEVEIIHDYKPQQPIDEEHGEPYNWIAGGNRSITVTTLKDIVDIPIEINGTGLSSGTLEFDGSGLVFHKASGEPFTVTYTLDAVAKDVTR